MPNTLHIATTAIVPARIAAKLSLREAPGVPNPGMKGTSVLCGASILIVLFLNCSHALSPAGRLPVAAAKVEAAADAGIGASWRGLNDSRSSE